MKWRPDGELTERQRRFVEAYLLDPNARQAAIAAGYSAKTADVTGAQLVALPKIAAFLDEVRRKRLATVEISRERVLRELAALAFSNVDHYVVDEKGAVTLAPDAPADAMRAVSSIKRRITTTEDGKTITRVEIKLWDKALPLKLAGRHVGLFANKDDAAIRALAKNIVDGMLDEARARRRQQAAEEGRLLDAGTDED